MYNIYIYKMLYSVTEWAEIFIAAHIIVFSFIFIYSFDLFQMFSTWSSEIMYNSNKFKIRLIKDYFVSLLGKPSRAMPFSVLDKCYAKAHNIVPSTLPVTPAVLVHGTENLYLAPIPHVFLWCLFSALQLIGVLHIWDDKLLSVI